MKILTIDEQIKRLNESVWCTVLPSPIEGVGVFAIRDIPNGTIIWARKKEIFNIPIDRLNEIQKDVRKLLLDKFPFPKRGREFFSPNNTFEMPMFMNHSDNPNCLQGLLYCIALRDINRGEEITQNYKELDMDFADIQRQHWSNLLN